MWPFDRTLTETFQKPSLCLRAQRSYTSRPKSSPTDNRIWHNTPSEAPTQRDPWSTRQHGEPQHQTLQKVTKKLHITKKLHSHVTFCVFDCFCLWTTIFFKFQGCLYQKLHAKSYQEVTEKLQALLGEFASLPSPIPVRGGLREARGGGGPRGGRVWAFRTPRILELSALYISPHPLPPVLRAALFGSIPL